MKAFFEYRYTFFFCYFSSLLLSSNNAQPSAYTVLAQAFFLQPTTKAGILCFNYPSLKVLLRLKPGISFFFTYTTCIIYPHSITMPATTRERKKKEASTQPLSLFFYAPVHTGEKKDSKKKLKKGRKRAGRM